MKYSILRFSICVMFGCGTVSFGGPPQANGRLDGMYMRMMSSFTGKYFSFYPQHFVFRPDGRYVEGVPTGGFGKADGYCQAKPSLCGTYSISGGKLTLTPVTGKASVETFKALPDGNLELGGKFARRIDPFPPGKRLSGKYTYLSGSRSGAGFLGGAQTFVFYEDGRVEVSRVGTGSVQGPGVSAASSSSSGHAGKYQLKGFEMVLRDTSGRETVHTIYPFSDEQHKEILNIDGINFFRELK